MTATPVLSPDVRRHFRASSWESPPLYLARAARLGLIPRSLAQARIKRWKRMANPVRHRSSNP